MSVDLQHYYNNFVAGYRRFWSSDHIHYGLWDKKTKSKKQALLNSSILIEQELDLKPDDRVLDAGCGFGGTSLYLSNRRNINVIGISNSHAHVKLANKMACKLENGLIPRFYNRDFTQTGFSEESFTKIFAIESVSHAEDKKLFIQEAYRLLKPGGKLVVLDGFKHQMKTTSSQKRAYSQFLEGWFLPNLATQEEFENYMLKTGFYKVKFKDKTSEIFRSSFLISKVSQLMFPFIYIKFRLGLNPFWKCKHMIASIKQYECLQQGVWHYGVFTATKPDS